MGNLAFRIVNVETRKKNVEKAPHGEGNSRTGRNETV